MERLELGSKVNVQISNGFIILTSTDDSNDHKFNQIAKCINEKQRSVFKYEFLRRRENSSFISNHSESYLTFFSTRSSCLNNLNKITSIRISIIRTLNSTSPCLNSIKIYGYLTDSPIESNQFQQMNDNKNLELKRVEIPDEFIDELTHEMMRLPIKLPSQKYIDKSTLDKYLLEKRNKLQPESDPFTNIQFSSVYKPIIDETLKSKIDKFLFDNQNSILIFKNNAANSKRKSSTGLDNYLTQQAILKKLKLDLIEENSSKKDETEFKNNKKCNCCLNLKSQFRNMYEITTCKHVYCSHCIKSIDRICIICNKKFETNQIINLDRINMINN